MSIALLGLLFKRLMVDPMLRHGVLPLVIATIGLAILMKEACANSTAPRRSRSRRWRPATTSRCSARRFALQSLVVLAVAIAAVAALQLFLTRTRTGRCMQATAQNPTVARILGIPVERMILYTFLINAALVTLASVLITPIYLAKFTNGEWLGLSAFIAAIVGGFNQVRGAIVGGLMLGVVDNFAAAYISAQYRGASAAAADPRHPVPSAGPARPARGAHGMSRRRKLVAGVALAARRRASCSPRRSCFKPYGIFS